MNRRSTSQLTRQKAVKRDQLAKALHIARGTKSRRLIRIVKELQEKYA